MRIDADGARYLESVLERGRAGKRSKTFARERNAALGKKAIKQPFWEAESEKDVERAVIDAGKAGNWSRRYHTFNSERSPAGLPDELWLRGFEFLVAELKDEIAEPTEEQIGWLLHFGALADRLREEGSSVALHVFLWRPSDKDEIASVMTARKLASV